MKKVGWLVPLIALVIGCSNSVPVAAPAAPVVVNIPAGTEIPLILAKHLRAGEAENGDYVPFLVAKDVIIDGNVAIPKGTPVGGEVTWSRSEGTMSGLMGQPARLEVKLKPISTEGMEIDLSTNSDEPDKPYSFTRDNTGAPALDETKVEDLLKTEMNRQVAEKLNDLFEGKSASLDSNDSKQAIAEITKTMGLADTQKLLDTGKTDVAKIGNTIERLQHGDLSQLTKGDLSLTFSAVMELANLAGGLGDRVARSLKGRTIHAYPGTVIKVTVANNVSLTITKP